MFEPEAGRKLTACLHQPLGDTEDMTDRQRHVPWFLSQGHRRSAWWERERGESDVCEQSLTMCATLTEKHLVRIRCFVQHVYMCTRIM